MLRCWLLSWSLCAVLWASPGAAFEKQWHIGAGAGAARFTSDALSLGPAAQVWMAYGISDMFDAKIGVSLSHHLGFANVPVEFLLPSAELAYKIDVIRWVPYVSLSAGYGVFLTEATLPKPLVSDLALGLALGLDYAVSRELGLGFVLRGHRLLAGGLLSDAFFRAEYRWGF